MDNLWVVCGPTVHHGETSRIVVSSIFDMSKTYLADTGFYPKSLLDLFYVSDHKLSNDF